jgi:hypothetical protein
MVKDKFLYSASFVITAIIYVSYLFYDFNNQEGWPKDFGLQKQREILTVEPNALLLGGSNVAYSLSAQQLSTLTKSSWYNLGIQAEAYTDGNYWDYVSSSLEEEQRSNIHLVVYSGLSYLRVGDLARRSKESRDTWGRRTLGWLPNKALISTLKNSFLPNDKVGVYPSPTIRGDFDFNEKVCDGNYIEAFEREVNWKEVENWIASQISTIASIFPNAQLIFVVPSEFYGQTYDSNLAGSYAARMASVIQSKFGSEVKFLAQPPYAEKSLTCDGRHHANEEGRAWRTKDLSIFLNSLNEP